MSKYIDKLDFNIEIGCSYKITQKMPRFSQLLLLQSSNKAGHGMFGLHGYGNDGGTERYYVSDITSGTYSVTIDGTSFIVKNESPSNSHATVIMFMGEYPSISKI